MAVAIQDRTPHHSRLAFAARRAVIAVKQSRPVSIELALLAAALLWTVVLTAIAICLYTAKTVWIYARVARAIGREVTVAHRPALFREASAARSGLRLTADVVAHFARARRRGDAVLYSIGVSGAICLGLLISRL